MQETKRNETVSLRKRIETKRARNETGSKRNAEFQYFRKRNETKRWSGKRMETDGNGWKQTETYGNAENGRERLPEARRNTFYYYLGDSLGTVWGQSGDSMATVWGQYADSMGTGWKRVETDKPVWCPLPSLSLYYIVPEGSEARGWKRMETVGNGWKRFLNQRKRIETKRYD